MVVLYPYGVGQVLGQNDLSIQKKKKKKKDCLNLLFTMVYKQCSKKVWFYF